MAPHAYQSLEPGAQIVISDEPREDLEELARWVSIPVPDKAPAEKKLTAAEKKAAKEAAETEATRIAALPIHVGDTVKLSTGAVADGILSDVDPDKAEAWRGTVAAVRAGDEGDVIDIEGGPEGTPLDRFEIAEPDDK